MRLDVPNATVRVGRMDSVAHALPTSLVAVLGERSALRGFERCAHASWQQWWACVHAGVQIVRVLPAGNHDGAPGERGARGQCTCASAPAHSGVQAFTLLEALVVDMFPKLRDTGQPAQ